MKNIFITLILILTAYCSFAQTNTFPSSGNVGIGTLTPTRTLDVNGQIQTNSGIIFYNGKYWDISSNGNGLFFNETGIKTRLSFLAGGNIGIGTTTPGAILDVGTLLNSGTLSTVLARLPEGNTTGSGTYLGIKGYDTQLTGNITNVTDIKSFAIEHSFYGSTNSSINFLRGNSTVGGSIAFNTDNNTEKMRILYNGNVGIGTTSPQNKLDVNGTIHSKQVNVDLNAWPDYVFKPTYHLPTLTEIKAYIDQNHHLPEMPSEQQIINEGLNLGEMNKLLTKKVEELTLYLIEQNKQLTDQQKINQSLQEQINTLSKAIKDHLNN